MTRDTIYNLQVCNDSIVRGIKLVTDFLHLPHKEENLQNCVFVLEENLKKSITMENVLSSLFNVVLLYIVAEQILPFKI